MAFLSQNLPVARQVRGLALRAVLSCHAGPLLVLAPNLGSKLNVDRALLCICWWLLAGKAWYAVHGTKVMVHGARSKVHSQCKKKRGSYADGYGHGGSSGDGDSCGSYGCYGCYGCCSFCAMNLARRTASGSCAHK